MTRRIGVAALAVALLGCFPPPAPRRAGAPRERVESLWDFAPVDASLGAVFHERSFSRALAMWASLREHATARPGKAKAHDHEEPPTKDTLPRSRPPTIGPAPDSTRRSRQRSSPGLILIEAP